MSNQLSFHTTKSDSAVFVWLLIFPFAACQNTPQTPALPNTPETVATYWQACIDKNQFDLARHLSADAALQYISEVATYAEGDTSEGEINEMLNLRCEIIGGDSAICNYHFKDELGTQLPGKLALKKIKGQWKVNRVDFELDLPIDTSQLVFPADTLELE